MKLFLALVLAAAPLKLGAQSPRACGLYGFSAGAAPYQDASAEELARRLSDWGVNVVFGGYRDRREAAALRGRGIRLMAVLDCFQGEHIWRESSRSRPVTAAGTPLAKVRWYAGVCPSQVWLRRRLRDRAAALARNPLVDGLWLDFIRFPVHWEVPRPALIQTCFCPVCLAKFQKDTGLRLPGRLQTAKDRAAWILERHEREWSAWKCDHIAAFVAEIRRAVKAERPDFILGLFTVPWSREEQGSARMRIAGQDLAKLAAQADVLSPMVYHTLLGRGVDWVGQAVRDAAAEAGKPVWPILLAGEGRTVVPHGELLRAVEAVLGHPSSGLLLFPQEALASPEHRTGLPGLFAGCKAKGD